MSNKVFEYIHQNSSMTTDATSINDIIEGLEKHLQFFRDLKEAGVEMNNEDSDASTDYIVLTTASPDVAAKFGFEPQDFWGEEEDDDWDDVEDYLEY